MVESGEQAPELARADRYPPKGIRGVGSALARASGFAAILDYLVTVDDEICLLLQVENRAGLAALDDILAVEGVDGVFIRPSDLAADMGHIGKPAAPVIQAAITEAVPRILASGKAAGTLAFDRAAIEAYVKLDMTFIAVGIDVTLLAGAARELCTSGRNSIGNGKAWQELPSRGRQPGWRGTPAIQPAANFRATRGAAEPGMAVTHRQRQ